MNLKNRTLLQQGKYKIVETIGQGGFGFTYLATHSFVGQKVAIKELFVQGVCMRSSKLFGNKVFWTNGSVEQKTKELFIKEVKTLWKLRHPHIVHVKDVFEENGTIYFVMEFINGENLLKLLQKQGSLPEDVALDYIKQVAHGLKYMHRKRRLHLDIKPNNLIVDAKGYVYIIDFGSSVHLMESGIVTTTSAPLSYTPGFASYEVQTHSIELSAAADVYSLGATLYTLLTNQVPPEAEKRMLGVDHLKPLPETISSNTRKVVEKALRKKASNRYQSIDEFLKHLEPKKTK